MSVIAIKPKSYFQMLSARQIIVPLTHFIKIRYNDNTFRDKSHVYL